MGVFAIFVNYRKILSGKKMILDQRPEGSEGQAMQTSGEVLYTMETMASGPWMQPSIRVMGGLTGKGKRQG